MFSDNKNLNNTITRKNLDDLDEYTKRLSDEISEYINRMILNKIKQNYIDGIHKQQEP